MTTAINAHILDHILVMNPSRIRVEVRVTMHQHKKAVWGSCKYYVQYLKNQCLHCSA